MPDQQQSAVKQSQDPRERFPKPPFPPEKQPPPGSSQELDPPADYGEQSYAGSGKLRGRVALITGADSGIGRAVAVCFAKEGADIVFTHVPVEQEQRDARETLRIVESLGRKGKAIPRRREGQGFLPAARG